MKNLKKGAKLLAFALTLALGATLLASNNTFADDEPCIGPTTIDELNGSDYLGSNIAQITLCGDMAGTVGGEDGVLRTVTINLNGHSITGDPAIKVGRKNISNNYWPNYVYGRLTIAGDGEVNGGFSVSQGATLSLRGGEYTTNPQQYVGFGLRSYPANGKYIIKSYGYTVYSYDGQDYVEPTLSDNRSTSIFRDGNRNELFSDFVIEKGKSIELPALNLPEGSTTGTGYDFGVKTVAEVKDGKLIGKGTGKTTLTIYPTYDPSLSRTVNVTVYEVAPEDKDSEADKTSAGVVSDLLSGDWSEEDEEGTIDYPESWQTTFGEEDNEYQETGDNLTGSALAGQKITVGAEAKTVEEPSDEIKTMVEELLEEEGIEVSGIEYYDANIVIKAGDEEIGKVHDLGEGNEIKVFISETTDPEEGYEREYFVVRVHDGEPELLEEGTDYEIKDGKFYVISSKFSLFALAFLDNLIPVEEPEEPVEEPKETEKETENTGKGTYTITPVAKTGETEEKEKTTAPNTGTAVAKEVSSTASIFPIAALATLITFFGLAKTLKGRKVSA